VSELAKATLEKILSDSSETPDGTPFPVQFNPSSLKIRVTNTIEGGRAQARQVRQQTGNSSRTLSLELIFDTADEGTTSTPISVREKTKQLEQFISAPKDNPDPPPKLKFHWGDLIWVGISDSLDISLEHFAENGFPLRAKVNLSIKEQDPQIQFQPSNRDSGSAAPPGGKAGLPGAGTNLGFSAGISAGITAGIGIGGGVGIGAGVGVSAGAKIGLALEGETGAEFAARVGVDPKAWRGLETDLNTGASLNAGIQVGFNPANNSSPGVGSKGGVNSTESVSGLAASGLNLSESSANQSLKINSDVAGKAMSALGGVDGSINSLKIKQSQTDTDTSINAFGMDFTPETIENRPITRKPLLKSGISNYSDSVSASSKPPPAKIDARASSFGKGIPLQPLFGASQVQQSSKVYANRQQPMNSGFNSVPVSSSSCTPAWVALPKSDNNRAATDQIEYEKSLSPCQINLCDCSGGKS